MNSRVIRYLWVVLLSMTWALRVLAAGDIVVGQVVTYSGPDAEASRDYVAGAKTYFDYVNNLGGVNGRKIVHLVRDCAGEPAAALRLTRELIDKDGVDVLFGYVDEGAIAAVVQGVDFKARRLALVAPLSGASIGTPQDNVFYTRASYAAEAHKIVERFRAQGLDRFAVVYADTAYGRSVLRAVHEDLRASGRTPVMERKVRADGQGIGNEAKSIWADHPQVVIVIADTLPTAEFVQRYKPLDPGAFIVGLSLVNHTTLTEIDGPALATGMLLTQVVPNPLGSNTPLLREHLALMKKFRDEPPSHVTLEGFIAAKVLVRALQAAGKDPSRAAVTAALHGIAEVDHDDTYVTYLAVNKRDANFVDITFLRRNGTLLH